MNTPYTIAVTYHAKPGRRENFLRQLSADCGDQMENILYDYDILVHLDVIFARAQLSYQMSAARPEVRRRGGIVLRRTSSPPTSARSRCKGRGHAV